MEAGQIAGAAKEKFARRGGEERPRNCRKPQVKYGTALRPFICKAQLKKSP
jgi:hypothetical protein